MLEAVEIIEDHDAHLNEEEKGFDHCTNVMAHAESKEEAREIAALLHEEFGVKGE